MMGLRFVLWSLPLTLFLVYLSQGNSISSCFLPKGMIYQVTSFCCII
jgi:hypothetical protein